MNLAEIQQIIQLLIALVSAIAALLASFHVMKARAAIEEHKIKAEGKDRVIADMVTVANMTPEIAQAVAPLIAAVKTAAQPPTFTFTGTTGSPPPLPSGPSTSSAEPGGV